ncbi:hypothetical protein FBUS_03313 [Fasciolopsis buskii]|uniref:Uncharacterized protein n=1 Tax=Fasciolopsis buskii TaxID=27845 RepID=A0A8E0RIX3_9TREM|nr:hypothetical protein FBUS_03313 [Fasciolopsis buski]
MGGGFETSTNAHNAASLLNEPCVCDLIRPDYSNRRARSCSHSKSHSREQHGTKLPAIESTGTKRDANGQLMNKCQKSPWGDVKEGKVQASETLRFPLICKRWSPIPNAGRIRRQSETDSRGNCPGLLGNSNNGNYDPVSRVSSHMGANGGSTCGTSRTIGGSGGSGGPTPNPLLLPINFTDMGDGSEKRLRVKMKRIKSTSDDPDKDHAFPTLSTLHPTKTTGSQ